MSAAKSLWWTCKECGWKTEIGTMEAYIGAREMGLHLDTEHSCFEPGDIGCPGLDDFREEQG